MEVLYLFNPENDMALACGDPYYMAPANARRMAAELSVLPAWYAEEGASVCVDDLRRAKIIKKQCPLPLPVHLVTEISAIYNKVCPWGWSPVLVHHLQEAGMPAGVYPSGERMMRIRQLSGRQTAVEMLSRLRTTSRRGGGWPPECTIRSVIGQADAVPALSASLEDRIPSDDLSAYTVGESFVFQSEDEVERFVSFHPKALLKAPWSGSGRGIQYTSGTFSAPLKGWVEHILTTQHQVIGEPFYDKVLDFAMEFYSDADGGIRFVGYSIFKTDKRGSYKGNLLAPDAEIEARLAAYVPLEILLQLRGRLSVELADMIRGDYQGYLGVDMMVCEHPAEGYSIHPCVEINLRMNMGVVAHLVYSRYVCSGALGRYVIGYYPQPGAAQQAHIGFRQQYPLAMEGEKIKSGYLSLTPIETDTAYQAYIIVD